ncbi:MAG: hypothetical protein ACOVQ6_00595 [Brevundimonas sp.]
MIDITQSAEAIDAVINAMAAPRKRRPADSVVLADLKELHDRYVAHVRAVVADLIEDDAASDLNRFADSLDDVAHDWLRDAITMAERAEEERRLPDWDDIRDRQIDDRAYWAEVDRGRNEAKDAA